MRRARSPCRNRGTVWITRVSTNHEAAFRPEWSFLHLFHMFGIDGFRFVKMEGLSRFGPCGRSFSRFFCSRTTAFQSGKVSILPPASHQMLAHLICSHSALPKSCLFGNPIQRGRRHSSRSRDEGMVTQRKGSSSPARPRPGAIGKTSPDSSPIGASPTRLMRILHLCPILVGSARDRSLL